MANTIIGVDEAGRGPVIGPLVVTALRIPKRDIKLLEEMGVEESKKVSKNKRIYLYEAIIENCNKRKWNIRTIICPPCEIDLEVERNNLNKLEVKLFSEVIKKDGFSLKIEQINLDACDVNEERFGANVRSNLGEKWKKTKIISKHKMDDIDLVTGAASIIAKVTRDFEIEKIDKNMSFSIGSGYPSDPVTKIAVEKMILGNFPHEQLRWSWKTVKDKWVSVHKMPAPLRSEYDANIKQTSLDEW